MRKEKAHELLNNSSYTFARTAKKRNPHWYTLIKDWEDKEEFLEVVQFIRDNGVDEFFWKIKYICYHHKGWKYWTMGAPLDETILINKTYVSESYNKIAYKYDDLFKSDQYQKENKEIVGLLKPHIKGVSVLDIGSGTGLLLDLLSIDPKLYTGIDPSYGMVKQARLKHPLHKFQLSKLETCFDFSVLAVSLFGSMNYVLPSYFDKIDSISEYHFLMFYKEDYDPITYDVSNVNMYPFKHSLFDLKDQFINSKIFTWNNYYVVTNLNK